ncbi:MAG: nadA [Clostridia bacterium]|jgi:quinolinate synthase|uniref:quinolinate synthase NadA n=1 Tax=Petroclostridium xylanilyticum TaxID=1792311 RepID=UPI000B97FBEE|nr:quinolinate synthase NadA [Petroclostridium xylanilyticum]MBZ4645495.1 nadA [Clostridia bacterium]
MKEIINRIECLKRQKNAVILAHNYQIPEVQDIADFVGDSFALSKKAKEMTCDIIVFCGVHFMAESAKILSPEKTVLLPARDAGCPMAEMITAEDVAELRKQYPDAAVICYVNSSAEVKAVSDICCTSSNALKVVRSVPNRRIIFIPDENLGNYVAQQVPDKEIILFNGFCTTHKRVKVDEVDAAKRVLPDAKLLIHPECTPEVVKKADFVGSTAQIIDYATNSDDKEFIIGTEQGIMHWLQKNNPGKKFYLLSQKLICPNMKKTTLKEVLNSLENMTYEIKLSQEEISRAYSSLNKMLNVG